MWKASPHMDIHLDNQNYKDISLYWQCTLGYTDRSSLDHVYRTAHTACKLLPFDLHMPENLDLFPARYRRTTGDHSQRSLADTPPYMGMNLDMSTSFCCIQWRSLLIHFLNWFKKSEPSGAHVWKLAYNSNYKNHYPHKASQLLALFLQSLTQMTAKSADMHESLTTGNILV